jgi:hypothetical protein
MKSMLRQSMKNLDAISRRILVIAFSLALVLCSASLFVFSLATATTVQARETTPEPQGYNKMYNYAGLGIAGDHVYYIANDGVFYKLPLSRARVP